MQNQTLSPVPPCLQTIRALSRQALPLDLAKTRTTLDPDPQEDDIAVESHPDCHTEFGAHGYGLDGDDEDQEDDLS